MASVAPADFAAGRAISPEKVIPLNDSDLAEF